MAKFIEVVEIETEEVVKRIDVSDKSERQAETVLMGMLRNMDTENFFVREAE